MADRYTIAVVFAIEFEMSAFRYMLDEEHEDLPNPNQRIGQYILGKIHGHNVVLACLPGTQGKGEAARAATLVSTLFPAIKWYILVGIGGGVPSHRHDIRLGDVIVSMPSESYPGIVQYDLGRMGDNGAWQAKGSLSLLPEHLRYVANKMRSDHRLKPHKIEENTALLLAKSDELSEEYQRPEDSTDVLFEDDAPHLGEGRFSNCSNCDKTKIKQRKPRDSKKRVRIHYGLIASGDAVIMSTERRDEIINRLDGDVLCFEMEAAGIATELPCMVIRGISDYADSHKNKGWQHYAAANAAACAKELISLADPAYVEFGEDDGQGGEDVSSRPSEGTSGGGSIVNNNSQNSGLQSTGGHFGSITFHKQ